MAYWRTGVLKMALYILTKSNPITKAPAGTIFERKGVCLNKCLSKDGKYTLADIDWTILFADGFLPRYYPGYYARCKKCGEVVSLTVRRAVDMDKRIPCVCDQDGCDGILGVL